MLFFLENASENVKNMIPGNDPSLKFKFLPEESNFSVNYR